MFRLFGHIISFHKLIISQSDRVNKKIRKIVSKIVKELSPPLRQYCYHEMKRFKKKNRKHLNRIKNYNLNFNAAQYSWRCFCILKLSEIVHRFYFYRFYFFFRWKREMKIQFVYAGIMSGCVFSSYILVQ